MGFSRGTGSFNVMVAQSGGPTAAINASLAGVIGQCRRESEIDKIYGAINGIEGLISGHIVDIGEAVGDDLELLARTPAMALGSCRYRLADHKDAAADYKKAAAIFEQYQIGAFFYIGGNDSMDTADKLTEYLANRLPGVRVIGIPKTIDNDLPITDHTPGFGSAAKFVATAMLEIIRDCSIYPVNSVTIVEVMGRHAGWLTAAASLPNYFGSGAPQLTYLPEVPFDPGKFIVEIRSLLSREKSVIVAVSEGIKTADGCHLCHTGKNSEDDAFGHMQLSGAGKCLERLVSEQIGCKVRSVELNILQRCASHCASQTDLDEAMRAGEEAVKAACAGQTGKLVAIKRLSDVPYTTEFSLCDLCEVANKEKLFPLEWINRSGNGVTPAAYEYILPLIKGSVEPMTDGYLPKHFVLKKSKI